MQCAAQLLGDSNDLAHLVLQTLHAAAALRGAQTDSGDSGRWRWCAACLPGSEGACAQHGQRGGDPGRARLQGERKGGAVTAWATTPSFLDMSLHRSLAFCKLA